MKGLSFALLGISLLLLLFSFGCPQTPPSPPSQPPSEMPAENSTGNMSAPTNEPCSGGNILQKDECFLALAKTKADPETCKNIYSIDILESCYSIFAGNDIEICKKITNPEMRSECLTENAKREDSEEICQLIENHEKRNMCLEQVLPPCTLIEDSGEKELCRALLEGSYHLCSGDYCLMEYAINRSEEKSCALIMSESDKYACKAIVTENDSQCGNCMLNTTRDRCYLKAALELGTYSICQKISDGSEFETSCYLEFAVARNDYNICSKPFYETQRDECYKKFASLAADTRPCALVIESLNKIGCYYQAAADNSMPSLCNLLDNELHRNYCYTKGVFTDIGPVASECETIMSNSWKDKCYYTVAKKTLDKALCEKISPGSSDRISCDGLFGN